MYNEFFIKREVRDGCVTVYCLSIKATLWNFSTFIIYYQNPFRWYIDLQ